MCSQRPQRSLTEEHGSQEAVASTTLAALYTHRRSALQQSTGESFAIYLQSTWKRELVHLLSMSTYFEASLLSPMITVDRPWPSCANGVMAAAKPLFE